MTNESETTNHDPAGDGDVAATPADATPTGSAAAAVDQAAADAEGDAGEEATADDDDPDRAPGGEEQAEEAQPEEPDWEQRATEDGRSPGQLLEALQQVQGDRDEYLDALQRSRAEFDNFRRRSAREAAGARAAGVGDLATQLLDVLDDLDRTVQVAQSSSDEGLAAGITAVRRKLVDALLAAGVERIDAEGIPFDATRHEAVQKVDAEEPLDEPEVAQVLRPGYSHGDRVLRAAMVSVRQ